MNTNLHHTSKFSSSIKPFLLGFMVAVILIWVAILSSIYTICKDDIDYKINNHNNNVTILSSPIMKDDDICHSFDTTITEGEGRHEHMEEFGKKKNSRRRFPLLGLFSKKMKTVQSDVIPPVCNEIVQPTVPVPIPIPEKENPRRCFCHLILELLAYHNSQPNGTSTEETIHISSNHDHNLTTSEEQQKSSLLSNRYSSAFTEDRIHLSQEHEELVKKMATDVIDSIAAFRERALSVPWGGKGIVASTTVSYDWYAQTKQKNENKQPISANDCLDQIDGGNLFSSYLRIMAWPENLSDTNFPFKLCKKRRKEEGKGCDVSVPIQHTLEFRERYKPWIVTPGIIKANSQGLVYQRGLSPPHSNNVDGNGSHAIVILRLGRRVTTNDENGIFFVRAMVREFDKAVAASLQRSNGRMGKFNAIVDGTDFSWSTMPSIATVKNLVVILQDHFADRLGVVILVNIGRMCEILLKIFLSLITEEVRNKILILPHDERERHAALETVLGKDNVPIWLGGTDDYVFQVDAHYAKDVVTSDDEAKEYLTSMPYHS